MRIATIATLIFVLGSTSTYAGGPKIHQGTKPDVPVCGGFLGLVCGETEWCDYPQGVTCGGADHFGTCRPRPGSCTEEYLPVCGCNGEIFSNACHAAIAGFDVAYPGKCR